MTNKTIKALNQLNDRVEHLRKELAKAEAKKKAVEEAIEKAFRASGISLEDLGLDTPEADAEDTPVAPPAKSSPKRTGGAKKQTRAARKQRRAKASKASAQTDPEARVAKRSEKKRPLLGKAIVAVMSDIKDPMKAAEIVAELGARDWLPGSKNPRQAVALLLSNKCPDVFKRVGRGEYILASNGKSKSKSSHVDDTPDPALMADWKVDTTIPVEGNVATDPFVGTEI